MGVDLEVIDGVRVWRQTLLRSGTGDLSVGAGEGGVGGSAREGQAHQHGKRENGAPEREGADGAEATSRGVKTSSHVKPFKSQILVECSLGNATRPDRPKTAPASPPTSDVHR